MRICHPLSVVFVATLLSAAGLLHAEDANLGETLRASRWDRLIGTWVDEGANGALAATTYAWKYDDHVLEATSKLGELTATSLIGRNAQSGEVFHMGADDQGGSSLGKWTFNADEAVLELGFTAADGQQGGMKIRHALKDDDTMIVTIEAGEPITLTMIRKKQ